MPRKVDVDAMFSEEALELTVGGTTYTVESLSADCILRLQEAIEQRTPTGAIEGLFAILGSLGLSREEIGNWDFRRVLVVAKELVDHFTSVQQAAVQTGQSAEVAEVDGSIVN